jgi:hypothetical protein
VVNGFFFFFFCHDWGLKSGRCSCKEGTLLLDPYLQSCGYFFVVFWWCWGLNTGSWMPTMCRLLFRGYFVFLQNTLYFICIYFVLLLPWLDVLLKFLIYRARELDCILSLRLFLCMYVCVCVFSGTRVWTRCSTTWATSLVLFQCFYWIFICSLLFSSL